MTDEINPYRPPSGDVPVRKWWSWLFGGAAMSRLTLVQSERSWGTLVSGIMFYVDPAQEDLFIAASPSTVHTDERMDLVVAEVIRMLPVFLEECPIAAKQIEARTLVVRIIEGDLDPPKKFVRETRLDWDHLAMVLGDSGAE